MPGTVRPKTSFGYLQDINVGFVREKSLSFLNLPLDKSHFITEVMKNGSIKRFGKRYMDFTDMGGGLAGKAKAQKETWICYQERGS